MEKVGKEGVITVKDGKTLENVVEVTKGFKFDQGMISPYFITDRKEQKCKFENPLILLVEGKLSTIRQDDGLLRLLESVRFLNYLTVYVVIVLFLSQLTGSRQIEQTGNLKVFVLTEKPVSQTREN